MEKSKMKKVLEIKSKVEKIGSQYDDEAVNNVKNFLSKNFRVDIPSFFELNDDGNGWTELIDYDIPPEDFGNFSFLFKTVNLKVKAALNSAEYPGFVWMYIEYEYTHPGGGSNGKTTRYISKDNGKTFDNG